MSMRDRRGGFSMLELMVVISIIIVLVSMMFAVMNMLQNQRKKVMTKDMMGQLITGLQLYITTYPILGDTRDDRSSDFVDSPWTFLGRNPIAAGKTPYIDFEAKFLASGPAVGPFANATRDTGDQILDSYTIADHSNHLVWGIANKQSGGSGPYTYTDEIWIRSTCGTPTKYSDDLITRFTLINGQWTWVNYTEATTDPTYPAPSYFFP
jgi:type II secretory pathway pseudopilin PulG